MCFRTYANGKYKNTTWSYFCCSTDDTIFPAFTSIRSTITYQDQNLLSGRLEAFAATSFLQRLSALQDAVANVGEHTVATFHCHDSRADGCNWTVLVAKDPFRCWIGEHNDCNFWTVYAFGQVEFGDDFYSESFQFEVGFWIDGLWHVQNKNNLIDFTFLKGILWNIIFSNRNKHKFTYSEKLFTTTLMR